MKFIVQGRHVEITEALKGYTQLKVERFNRFFPNLTKVEVYFDSNPDGTFRAKVVVDLPKHKTLVCTENEKTLTAALDLATEAVERRLNDVKEKIRNKGDRERVTRRLTREM
jgi:putative sigma-54 modulation protein